MEGVGGGGLEGGREVVDEEEGEDLLVFNAASLKGRSHWIETDTFDA